MKRIRGYVICLFILVILFVPYRAFAFPGLDIGLSYRRPTPSGTMEYKPVAGYPGDIDLKNNLKFGAANKPFARIKAKPPMMLPNIYLMATSITFEGSGPLARDISFDNTTLPVDSNSTSSQIIQHPSQRSLQMYLEIELRNSHRIGSSF